LTRRDEAAVRYAAPLIEWIKKAEKEEGKPTKGRHERAIQQALDYMTEKGLPIPNRESLENYIRRSKQPKRRRSTKV
jgi:hypothetical protein